MLIATTPTHGSSSEGWLWLFWWNCLSVWWEWLNNMSREWKLWLFWWRCKAVYGNDWLCICINFKMYLYTLQYLFVQIAICICPNSKVCLSQFQNDNCNYFGDGANRCLAMYLYWICIVFVLNLYCICVGIRIVFVLNSYCICKIIVIILVTVQTRVWQWLAESQVAIYALLSAQSHSHHCYHRQNHRDHLDLHFNYDLKKIH